MKRSIKMFSEFLKASSLVLLASLLMASASPARQQAEHKTEAIARSSDRSLVEVTSRIQQVIVYPDRAQVIRKGEASLTPETRSLVFRGLPGTIIPGSVRVAASGQAPVKIIGVEVSREFLEAEKLPEVRKIMEEISSVESEMASLKGQEAILEAQEKFLNSFGAAFSNQASRELLAGRPDLSGVDKFVDYLGARLQSIQKSRQDNARALAEKQARLEALKKKLKEIMPAGSREQQNITVLVESTRTAGLQVELSYDVSPASWNPIYTIKALPELGEIELTVAAIVKQRTGENWDNVNLLLSTSRPTAGNQPGELSPWYLDFFQPRMMRAASRDLVEAKMAMEAEAAPALALEETAEMVETWLGVNFEIKKAWTIASDGAERRVPIDSQKMPAAFDYLSVPKLQELCFLRSSFKSTLPYPLLPGRADLFIAQDFVGSLGLNLLPAGDELQLFFGQDNQVKVKRELVKREKSGPGFLGKNERVNQVFRITLENLRNRPVEVEVKDQLPVSQNTKIEVKDVKIMPAPSSRDENGILTWKLKLEPRQKQEIILDFTVEYPKGSRVIGI
ncbi:MAG: mucoidy inhibitor MuiA family protein [Candidatus Aminicenantes bacterium]|nr:mucoidy inhibitor MuiA family protein [Candidatus Aminicenantes bacterium]